MQVRLTQADREVDEERARDQDLKIQGSVACSETSGLGEPWIGNPHVATTWFI